MAQPESTIKTMNLEINILTFEKMRNLLNEYRTLYGLQNYDDLINFLIKNQPVIKNKL
ncbi:MAG: hypothetical protein J4428_00490 [Candidatus Aenigmarchaeota archaeon]|nr:hypothetical protein [Candidatus Aenigmarchaeota archaeon]